MILIPVKNLSSAKQRLAALLDQPSRTELAHAMLQDVVSALAAWADRPACALVTDDPFAIELAEQYDFELIPDRANSGETAAIEMATRLCVARGIESTLVIPGDIPLIQATEIDQILSHAPTEGSVLVPIALNRKNALFAGSDGGGEHWAILASLIETCKLNGIDPQGYLTDVITRIFVSSTFRQ